MRRLVVWAALAVATLCAPKATGATYASDAAYQFTGQDYSTSGRGLAVNAAETRLYATYRKSSGGNVQVLDIASGTWQTPISVPTPTAINDIALSPDDAKLYIARITVSGSAGEIDVADAAPGAAAVTAIAFTDGTGATLGIPTSLAVAKGGDSLYIGATTNTAFHIFRSDAGGPFALQSSVDLGYTSNTRKVIAADAGGGAAFYVLTSGSASAPNIRQVALDGSIPSMTWDALPSSFTGYTFDGIIPAGTVDGTPSVYVAADTTDDLGNAALTVFRYGLDGTYQNDGFGYQLSSTEPLSALQALDTTPTLVPGAVSGSHLYIGAIRPDLFDAGDQTVRVTVQNSTIVPVQVSGTVRDSTSAPVAGAKVVILGKNTPVATTDANGVYTFTSVNPTASLTLGASKTGYIAASATFNVPAGADKSGADLTLPGAVPVFPLAHAFAPIIPDGVLFAGKYLASPMAFYVPSGADVDPAIQTFAYAQWDAEGLYIAVDCREPDTANNTALWGNQNMLVYDDNIQIYVDPAHRHNVKGTAYNLFQFAVNVPPTVGGVPSQTPLKFQRRITTTGALAQTLSSSAWSAHVGYYPGGYVVEARISTSYLSPFALPADGATWGLLVARHRPTTHADNRPTDFSTSPVQANGFQDSTAWTDVPFTPTPANVPGDVNGSGAVDLTDAIYALRMAGGLSYGTQYAGDTWNDPDSNATIRAAVLAKADVWPAGAPDGRITLEDAARLVRAAMGADSIQ